MLSTEKLCQSALTAVSIKLTKLLQLLTKKLTKLLQPITSELSYDSLSTNKSMAIMKLILLML